MLHRFTTEYLLLKLKGAVLIISLQGHTKEFSYRMVHGVKSFTVHFIFY